MSDTYVVYGIKFGEEDWVPLLGNLLVIIGISLTLYIALFVGGEEAAERAEVEAPAKKEKAEAEKTPKKTSKADKERAATPTSEKKDKKESTSEKKEKKEPASEKKSKKEPVSTMKEKKEAAPVPAPATTPKKRATTPRKKAVEDMGHIMSPEGRRSMRLKTKTDDDE